MRFRRVAALLGVAVFAQLVATAPPKVPSAKWAQTIDGTVFVTIQLKRGGSQLCEGEEASIVPPDGLRFQMSCVGEAWALSIELPHGVEDRVAIRRERAQVVLSQEVGSYHLVAVTSQISRKVQDVAAARHHSRRPRAGPG